MKFETGKSYDRCGLFGPSFWVTCMALKGGNAAFIQTGYEHEPETEWKWIEIQVDTDETEMCECWSYMGHKGYIKADSCY